MTSWWSHWIVRGGGQWLFPAPRMSGDISTPFYFYDCHWGCIKLVVSFSSFKNRLQFGKGWSHSQKNQKNGFGGESMIGVSHSWTVIHVKFSVILGFLPYKSRVFSVILVFELAGREIATDFPPTRSVSAMPQAGNSAGEPKSACTKSGVGTLEMFSTRFFPVTLSGALCDLFMG